MEKEESEINLSRDPTPAKIIEQVFPTVPDSNLEIPIKQKKTRAKKDKIKDESKRIKKQRVKKEK